MSMPLFVGECEPPIINEKRRKRFGPRDTGTGAKTEMIIVSALRENGYLVSSRKTNQVVARSYGIDHTPDWIARNGDREIIVEVKYQGVPGTIYWKSLAEVVRLSRAMRTNKPRFSAAYIVIVSDVIPQTWLDAMFRQEYLDEVPGARNVHCVTADTFITKCNRRKL